MVGEKGVEKVVTKSGKVYFTPPTATLVDLPKRTVRYYMQIGLVDRPEGLNRGAKYYARHLEQLLGIRKWQEAGLSLDRIRELLITPDPNAPDGAKNATLAPKAAELSNQLRLLQQQQPTQ